MKKFFIRAFLFSLPLLAGFVLLEKKLALVPNSYNQKIKWLDPKVADIEVLVVGTSHTLYGVDPAEFSHKGFNLANISQTPYYDARLVETYLPKMPKLKVVIIPISYFSFFKQLTEGAEDWRVYFYNYYWHIPIEGDKLFDFNKYSLFTIYTPYSSLGFARMGFRNPSAPIYTNTGFERKDTLGHLAAITDDKGRDRAEFLSRGYTDTNYNKGVADYEYLVRLLRKNHIEPVFITPPVYTTFLKHCNPAIIARNRQVAEQMGKMYLVRYLDYMQDSRFGIDDFCDNDHLNFLGAQKMSRILDTDIVKPLLK